MPALANTLQELIQHRIRDNVADAVYNKTPTLAYLMATRGEVETRMGPDLHHPVQVTAGPSGQWISNLETVTGYQVDNLRSLAFTMPSLVTNLDFSRMNLIHAMNEGSLGSLVDWSVRAGLMQQRDDIASIGFTGTTGANQFDGMQTAVAATGTYGGLPRATFTNLQSYVDAATTANSVAFLQGIISQIQRTGSSPDFAVSTPAIYNTSWVLFENKANLYRVTNSVDTEYGKIGFEGLMVNGTTALCMDTKVPADHLFVLYTPEWHLVFGEAGQFATSEVMRGYDQVAFRVQLITDVFLYCSNPRLQAKATALTS